jgi:hypothetical protein
MELDGWARGFQTESPGDQSPSYQQVAGSSKDASPLHPSLPTHNVPGSYCGESEDSSDSDTAKGDLQHRLQMLSITPNSRRYFGKSSGLNLVQSALSAKAKASSGESPIIEPKRRLQRRDDFWNMRPVGLRLLIVLFSHFLIDRP